MDVEIINQIFAEELSWRRNSGQDPNRTFVQFEANGEARTFCGPFEVLSDIPGLFDQGQCCNFQEAVKCFSDYIQNT